MVKSKKGAIEVTAILVLADLTDDSLTKMIDCHKKQKTEASLSAAAVFGAVPDAKDIKPEATVITSAP